MRNIKNQSTPSETKSVGMNRSIYHPLKADRFYLLSKTYLD